MKNLLIIGGLFLLVALCLIIFPNPFFSSLAGNENRPMVQVSVGQFVVETSVLSEEAERCTLKLEIPEMTAFFNQGIQRRVNQQIKDAILRKVNDFKKEVKKWNREVNTDSDETSFIECGYQVTGQSEDYLSLDVRFLYYFAGATHPLQACLSQTFDLQNGRLVKLEELFSSDTNYLNVISDYCTMELTAQGLPAEDVAAGASIKAENFMNFNLSPDALIINFSLYQVGPYVIGQPSVNIPWENLKALAAPRLQRWIFK